MVKQIVASNMVTLTDLSDAIISGTKPTSPKLDQLWIERKTGSPDKLWRWNGTAWIEQTLDLSTLDPDADDKIENHEITIGNMVDDSKLDITERQEVKNKLTPIIGETVVDNLASIKNVDQLITLGVGEVASVLKAALNVGIKTNDTEYAEVRVKYNNLATYLNAMTPVKPWDASAANKDKIITVVPTDWRGKWLDYYKSVQLLTVAIQTKLQGNINSVEIGGLNLVDNTDIKDITGRRIAGTKPWKLSVYGPNEVSGKCLLLESKDPATGAYIPMPLGQYIAIEDYGNTFSVKAGKQYTWSALVATSELGDMLDYTFLIYSTTGGNQRMDTIKTTDFQQISPIYVGATRYFYQVQITFTAIRDDDKVWMMVGGKTTRELDGTNGYAWIRMYKMKVETGNKRTDWNYSVNDVNKMVSDVDTKAQKVTDSVNDMSIDSKLTPVEKIQLKTDYESITSEFAPTLASADAFNLTSSSERVAYNATYGSLKTFVDPLLVKMNETSGVDRTVFRQRFKDYYDTKAKLLKKISDTSKGLIDNISSGRNLLLNTTFYKGMTNWTSVTGVVIDQNVKYNGYPTLRSIQVNNQTNVYRGAEQKDVKFEIGSQYTASFYVMTDDITSFVDSNDVIKGEIICEDDKATPTRTATFSSDFDIKSLGNNKWARFTWTTGNIPPGTAKIRVCCRVWKNGRLWIGCPMWEKGNTTSEWTPSIEDIQDLITITDTKAEESKNSIGDMSNDSKLTPIEKVQLKKEWGTMVAEKPQFESLANSLKITIELNDYINAYNTLNNTLNGTNGYLKNMQSTDDINAATFRGQFDNYYAKQAALIKKVNQVIQGNVDNMEVKTTNYVFNSTFKFGSANWTGIDSAATRNVTTVKGLEGFGIYTGVRVTDATAFIAQNLKPEPFVATKGFVSTYINVKALQTANTNKPRVYMRFAYDQGDPANPKYYYAICSQETVTNGWVRISLPFDTRSYTGKLIEVRVNLATADMTSVDVEFAGIMVNLGDKLADWIPSSDDNVYGEISVQGSAFEQTDKYRKLIVNGVEIYNESAGRGLRMTTLRRTDLKVTYDTTFDVYGSAAERTNLANKINGMKDDAFIVLSSWDAITFDSNLLSAMISIGGSGSMMNGRVPFAFIGMKGLGRYNGLEQYTGIGSLFSPAQISAKVVGGSLQGVNNNTGAADTTMRQDLRITAPLPNSIDLDANGITAKTTTAGKYARMDYRGLYIAGGAIQIDGGLPEGQLSQSVTNKFTYIDSTGVYTGTVKANQIIANSIKTQQLDVNEIFGNSAVINKIAAVDIAGERITAGTIKAKNGGFNIDVNRGEIWFNAPNQTKPITSFVQAKAGVTDITYWVVEANNNPNAMLALGVRAADGSIANYLQIDSASGKLSLLSNEVKFLSGAYFDRKILGSTWVIDPIGGAKGYAAIIPYTPSTGSLGLGNYRWEELNANWVNYAELNKFSTRKSKKDIELASHEIAEKIVREIDIYNYIYNHSESIEDNIQTGWIFEEVMKHKYAHLIANPSKEGMKADVIPAINWLVIQTLLKRMDEKDTQLNNLQQQIDKLTK